MKRLAGDDGLVVVMDERVSESSRPMPTRSSI